MLLSLETFRIRTNYSFKYTSVEIAILFDLFEGSNPKICVDVFVSK